METNRKFDSSQERLVDLFAHKYFFSKLDSTAKMVDNKADQINGIDEVFNNRNVDLKAQSSKRYLNNPTETFILEVSFYDRSGELSDGWFIKPDLKTDDYAFIWIPKAKVDANGALTSAEDIEEMELMLVDKHSLKSYINSFQSDDDLWNSAIDMRETDTKRQDVQSGVYGVHLSYTSTLAEEPVCLVTKKWLLKKFATKHCIITKESIKDI